MQNELTCQLPQDSSCSYPVFSCQYWGIVAASGLCLVYMYIHTLSSFGPCSTLSTWIVDMHPLRNSAAFCIHTCTLHACCNIMLPFVFFYPCRDIFGVRWCCFAALWRAWCIHIQLSSWMSLATCCSKNLCSPCVNSQCTTVFVTWLLTATSEARTTSSVLIIALNITIGHSGLLELSIIEISTM